MGLKCLRDGIESANLVSMYSVNGNPDNNWNFFSQDFSTHVGPGETLATKLLLKKFATFSDLIQEIGLSDWAQHDQHGNEHPNPQFPYELVFKPNESVKNLFSSAEPKNYYMQYILDLGYVPANSNIYDVYAWDKPAQIGGKLTKIGALNIEDRLIKSKFADENLFFRHQRIEDDLKFRPEWTPYEASYKLGGKCPYQNMLEELNLY